MADNENPPVDDESIQKAKKQKPHFYTSVNEVPTGWRMLRGARLAIEQINEIVKLAYELQYEQNNTFIPDWGRARQKFQIDKEVIDGFWVTAKSAKTDDSETTETASKEKLNNVIA